MDLHIFDKSFNRIAIFDAYESLMWNRDYYGIGNFELHTHNQDPYTLSILKKGYLIVKDNDPSDAMEIEELYLTDKLVVKGRSIDNLLGLRIVWNFKEYTNTSSNIIRALVNENCITTDTARRLPNLAIGSVVTTTGNVTEQPFGKILSEVVSELCLKYDIGWKVRFDFDSKKYYFDLYIGPDHTVDQSTNARLMFSREYENIYNLSYTNSDKPLKNTAMVIGTGEEPKARVYIGQNNSGFARREVLIDAGDISNKTEEGDDIPVSTYANLLNQRGLTRLAEMGSITAFECDVSNLSNLTYRVDFDLGYKVTVFDTDWDVILNTRIVAIEEIYENGVQDVRITFGTMIPTLGNLLNRVVIR